MAPMHTTVTTTKTTQGCAKDDGVVDDHAGDDPDGNMTLTTIASG